MVCQWWLPTGGGRWSTFEDHGSGAIGPPRSSGLGMRVNGRTAAIRLTVAESGAVGDCGTHSVLESAASCGLILRRVARGLEAAPPIRAPGWPGRFPVHYRIFVACPVQLHARPGRVGELDVCEYNSTRRSSGTRNPRQAPPPGKRRKEPVKKACKLIAASARMVAVGAFGASDLSKTSTVTPPPPPACMRRCSFVATHMGCTVLHCPRRWRPRSARPAARVGG